MTTDAADSADSLYSRLPWYVQLGLSLTGFVYFGGILTDTIEPQIPSDVWAVVYFAVAAYLFVRAVRLSRQS